jgi:hypothetical protein
MQAWRARRIPASWSWLAVVAPLWLGCLHRAGETAAGFPAGMTRPHPVTPIDWSYPPETTAHGVAGALSVRCVITEEGRAQECQTVKSIPGIDHWVIGKLESASFVPATYGGTPVRVSYVFNFRFDVPPASQRAARWRPPLRPGEAEACQGSNAQSCMAAALGLLFPDGGVRDPDRAGRLLGAACASGLGAACRRLDESFQSPRLLDEVPAPNLSDFTGAEGEVVCWISASGQARDCRGPDSPPPVTGSSSTSSMPASLPPPSSESHSRPSTRFVSPSAVAAELQLAEAVQLAFPGPLEVVLPSAG